MNTVVLDDQKYYSVLVAFRAAEDEYFADPKNDAKARAYQRAYREFQKERQEREKARRQAAK